MRNTTLVPLAIVTILLGWLAGCSADLQLEHTAGKTTVNLKTQATRADNNSNATKATTADAR